MRYEFNSSKIVLKLKNIRHDCIIENILDYIPHRDTDTDCLKDISTSSEMTKTSIQNILIANIKRAQESARVLEEIFKLYLEENSSKFKDIRYRLYAIEKDIFLDIAKDI